MRRFNTTGQDASNLKQVVCSTEETEKDPGVLGQILMKVLHTSERKTSRVNGLNQIINTDIESNDWCVHNDKQDVFLRR